MKIWIKATIASLVFSFTTPALAESAVGNGGIGIVCYKNPKLQKEVRLIHLLDFAEGIYVHAQTYERFKKNKSLILDALGRLSRVLPKQAKSYYKQLKDFKNDSVMKKGSEILDPEDTYSWINYKGCFHKTIILQTRLEVPGLPKYHINEDLFKLLSPPMRDMLLFHEVLYRNAIDFGGATDSVFVRRVTGILFKDSWSREDEKMIHFLFKTNGMIRRY